MDPYQDQEARLQPTQGLNTQSATATVKTKDSDDVNWGGKGIGRAGVDVSGGRGGMNGTNGIYYIR